MNMDSDIVKLTREELYQMVWSKPVTKWAKEFGLSDVGFAKICKKMKVPLPGRGYWAMVQRALSLLGQSLNRSMIQNSQWSKSEREH